MGEVGGDLKVTHSNQLNADCHGRRPRPPLSQTKDLSVTLTHKPVTNAEDQKATIPKYNHKLTHVNKHKHTVPVKSFGSSQATLKPDKSWELYL